MKRSYIKRKSKLHTSPKGKLIKKIDDLIRAELKRDRGDRCEICFRTSDNLPYPLSTFHILPKGNYPRIRFHKENLLLACWSPQYYIGFCHNIWHHNPFKRDKIEKRIIELRGPDYEDRLKVLNATAPKITATYLKMLYEAYKKGGKHE